MPFFQCHFSCPFYSFLFFPKPFFPKYRKYLQYKLSRDVMKNIFAHRVSNIPRLNQTVNMTTLRPCWSSFSYILLFPFSTGQIAFPINSIPTYYALCPSLVARLRIPLLMFWLLEMSQAIFLLQFKATVSFKAR